MGFCILIILEQEHQNQSVIHSVCLSIHPSIHAPTYLPIYVSPFTSFKLILFIYCAIIREGARTPHRCVPPQNPCIYIYVCVCVCVYIYTHIHTHPAHYSLAAVPRPHAGSTNHDSNIYHWHIVLRTATRCFTAV